MLQNIIDRRVLVVLSFSALFSAPTQAQSVVTGASPTPLMLQVGDAEKVIILNGQKLDRLNGAFIRRNGVKVTAFKTELPPTTNPLYRQIRLAALPGAGPPYGVPLELIVTDGTTNHEVPIQITVQLPTPDLSFDRCSASHSTNALVLRATMKNTGLVPATFQAGQVVAELTFAAPGSAFPLLEKIQAPTGGFYVAAGGTATLEKQLGVVVAGTYNANWKLNPVQAVSESNSTNNTRDCPVQITRDLVVASLTAQPEAPRAGTPVSLEIKISNRGNTSVAENYEVRCLLDNAVFTGNILSLGNINSNETLTRQINLGSTLPPGTKTVSCTVDHNNRVTETNENNNALSMTFAISG